jgi:hypothetical protein
MAGMSSSLFNVFLGAAKVQTFVFYANEIIKNGII